MAKKKIEQIEQLPSELQDDFDSFLEKKTGVKVQSLKKAGVIPYWIDSGCIALNWIISNDFFKGIPGTVNMAISGDPGKGKSFLLDVILGNNIKMGGKSFKVNIEKAANYEFSIKIMGGESIADQVKIVEPEDGEVISIEKLTSFLNNVLNYQAAAKGKKWPSVVVGIDSVTQLTTEKEYATVTGEKDTKDMTAAVKMRELFRVVEQRQEPANLSIIGIAQLTANIQTGWVPPGTPPKKPNMKGSGFDFASSLTINMITDKEIKDTKTDTPIGVKMRMKTTKNRVQYKGRSCWIHFYFQKGVDRFGGLPELLATYGILKPVFRTEAIDKKTGEVKLDENGNPKISQKKSEPTSAGEFDPETIFLYERDGKEIAFSLKNAKQVIEENGGDELLKQWNKELNDKYTNILDGDGIGEEGLLTSDDNYESE